VKVLVTGARGFIGSHVCADLINADCRVLGIDTAEANERASEGRKALLGDSVRFEVCDVSSLSLSPVIAVFRPDVIVHLAGVANPRKSIDFPERYLTNNIAAGLNLFRAAKALGIPKIVYASSSSVYGRGGVPYYEDDPLNPLSYYAASKVALEATANAYAAQGVVSVGLRFFTVYGRHGRPDMAPYMFTDAVLNGREVNLFGNGGRSYTHVSDVVLAIRSAIMQHAVGHEVYNVGGDRIVRTKELLEFIGKTLSLPIHFKDVGSSPGEPSVTVPSLQKIKDAYSWTPKVPFEKGMADFIQWMVESK